MKKIFYRIINPFRNAYWFIFRPKTAGVKCLIENGDKFLMIRNSYGHKQWTFPGGGIHKGEVPEKAAKREAREEVGIELTKLMPIGECFSTRQYKQDTVHCFYAKTDNDYFKTDNDEVSEAAWFSKSAIPEKRSSAVDKVLNLYHLKFKL